MQASQSPQNSVLQRNKEDPANPEPTECQDHGEEAKAIEVSIFGKNISHCRGCRQLGGVGSSVGFRAQINSVQLDPGFGEI